MTTTDDTPSKRLRLRSISPAYRSRRILIRLGIVCLSLAVLAGGAAVLVVHQAATVRGQLEGALDLAPQLRSQLAEGNQEETQQTFNQMQTQTSTARSTTGGPLWTVASSIPFAGANFSAVTEVAVSADDVVTRAVAPLLDVYGSLDWAALSPDSGQIDVSQLQESAHNIVQAADTVSLSHDRLASIDTSKLLPQLADPLRSATEQLAGADSALETASSVAQLLPSMLGADEPRNYLVLVQNNAESRATGGIPGALAILRTDGGHVSLGEQSSAVKLGPFEPPLDVDPEQEALYTARLGTQMQNVNLTPDFPTAATTAKNMWEERHVGEAIDGVLALDPVVLSYLLSATGPVDLTDPGVLSLVNGTTLPKSLTKDNVVSTLLADVYREIESPAAQDAYFAAVASQVFNAFTDGQGDSAKMLNALTTSAQEHRLYLWSNRTHEQNIISSTPIAGSVVGPAGGGAMFGVYFNDGTGAKMDYYVTRTVQLLKVCGSEGYSRYTARVNIANNAPSNSASTLPDYVTGGGTYGVDPGRIRTNYVFYGPAQSFVETATVNGQTVAIGSGKHGQRPVGSVTLELGPGESAEMDVLFSRVIQGSEPHLQVTPGLAPLEKVLLPTQSSGC